MFTADHVSLGPGQSYQNAEVLVGSDYEEYGVPRLFGDLTFAFLCQSRCLIINQWNLRVVKLTREPRGGRNGIPFERLVLDRDITYKDGTIIPADRYEEVGIPQVIGNGLTQLAWTCPDGLMLSHDANVVSVILKDPRGGETESVVLQSGFFTKPQRPSRRVSNTKLTPQA